MSKLYKGKIPYLDGRLWTGYRYSYRKDEIEWRDNTPFEATLEIVDWGSSRSSGGFTLKSDDGDEYWMFVSKALELIRGEVITHGRVKAWWGFHKQGSSYGLIYLGEKKP